MEFKGHFIDGRWDVRRGGTWQSVDPYRLEPVLEASHGDGQEVDDAVAAARRAFRTWRHTSIDERAEALRRLQAELTRRKEALADAITTEMGKTLAEARGEAQACIDKITITLGEGRKLIEPFTPQGLQGVCHFLPLGVMAVIGPYNFPAHLANGHIIPALLAGNTVVFKPSSVTPLVGQIYAEAMAAADLPAGVFNLLQISRPLGDMLISHPDVHGILFTGSYAVGRHIKKLTLDDPWKLLALEMGGKNFAIVWEDAHVEQAIAELVMGAWLTTGQRCTRTHRVVVHRSLSHVLEEALVQAASTLQSGDPRQPETFMGPLASRTAHEGFARAQQAVNGVRALVPYRSEGGNRVGATLHKVETFDRKNPYLTEEIFGPDLCIETVDTLEEAVDRATSTDYGLALSVFTSSRATYEQVLRDVPAGVVNWNRGTIGATGRLPFGGLGKSGNHRPAALFAPYYCTYPVAELSNVYGQVADKPCPGFPVQVLRQEKVS